MQQTTSVEVFFSCIFAGARVKEYCQYRDLLKDIFLNTGEKLATLFKCAKVLKYFINTFSVQKVQLLYCTLNFMCKMYKLER